MSQLLLIPHFLKAPDIADLRRVYGEGLAARRFVPRGGHTTDVSLRLVLGACGPCATKGSLNNWGRLRLSIGKRIAAHFGITAEVYPDYTAYTRVYPGGSHVLHADAVKLDGSPNHTPWRVLSAMLYLTEAGKDFDGGELVFPALAETVTPRPGLLVGFQDTLEFRHEVPAVTRGLREAIAMWFTTDATHSEPWPGAK